ncbi:MAG: VOC family protein [Deinococcota bacterium]|nr:VOC family protein [Deinococcota bacterium]
MSIKSTTRAQPINGEPTVIPAEPGSYGVQPPRYRLPSTTRLGRVRLQVAALERSLMFYRDLLGFDVLEHSQGRATLGAHGADTPCIELHEYAGAKLIPRHGRLGLYHFAVLLPERAALGRLVAHLERAGAYPGMSDHLVSEALYLRDPDGLGVEVYADRPRSLWRRSGRELVMKTDRLEVASLLREAGTTPWAGMPAGTTIGHVHLHVGDLDAAAAFYHEALGFDAVVWSYPGALFLSAGGYHHHLGLNTWAAGAPPSQKDEAKLLDWEIILPGAADADAAASSLQAQGYGVTQTDGVWSATDPWGTTVKINGET